MKAKIFLIFFVFSTLSVWGQGVITKPVKSAQKTETKPVQQKKPVQKTLTSKPAATEASAYDVTFSSNVPTATMYIDGTNYGNPSGTRLLKTGNHIIKLTAEGYEPYTSDICVQRNAVRFSFQMTKAKVTTGTINGHEWVDLGLPSGTKWATCNIGATKPEEYGKYYAWAEIETKSRYSWNNCKDCLDNTGDTWKKYKENGLQKISSGDDVAYQTWGQKWRLPTMDEASELYKNCKVTEETVNGINGIRITGPNSNSIFLPYSGFKGEDKILNVGKEGYYWTNELFSEYPYHAWCMEAFGEHLNLNYKERAKGLTIRPVTK